MLSNVPKQLATAADAFVWRFHRAPRFAAVAPGRVNLIGEHTDYSGGFVLPMAIQRQTLVVADRVPDGLRRATVYSAGIDAPAVFDVSNQLAPGEPKWANYVKGVVLLCLQRGLDPGGFDAVVTSTVPVGAGLSSSAALEVSTATLVEAMTGKSLGGVDKALLCQRAEHEFPRMPCGIMDQFISALGEEGHAMLLDTRAYEPRMVPLTDENLTVLITNSNVQHELTGGEYAERRAQVEAAAAAMQVPMLRDATMDLLEVRRQYMDPVTFRRARHVISENARTVDAAKKMIAGDWSAVGQRMFESHTSMRDDFEISTPEVDLLVELARSFVGRGLVYGSRMTGGGFGGCTVTLMQSQAVDEVGAFLCEQYQKKTGIEPTIFASRPAQGARALDLA